MVRTYSEMKRFKTFAERFKYLSLYGSVGKSTFGFDRYLNQRFYTSTQWRNLRNRIIARDLGCDLGIDGYEIHKFLYVHHMNPLTSSEITQGDSRILDPEFLITTTHRTHNAIHYGDESLLAQPLVERRSGDTRLW